MTALTATQSTFTPKLQPASQPAFFNRVFGMGDSSSWLWVCGRRPRWSINAEVVAPESTWIQACVICTFRIWNIGQSLTVTTTMSTLWLALTARRVYVLVMHPTHLFGGGIDTRRTEMLRSSGYTSRPWSRSPSLEVRHTVPFTKGIPMLGSRRRGQALEDKSNKQSRSVEEEGVRLTKRPVSGAFTGQIVK